MKKVTWFAALSFLMLPIVYLMLVAFFPVERFLVLDLGRPVLASLVLNTVQLCFISCILSLILGTVTSYLEVHYAFKGKDFIGTAIYLPILFPPYIVAMVFSEISHSLPGWVEPFLGSVWGGGFIFAFTLYPYVFILTKISLSSQGLIYMEIGKGLGLNRMVRIKKILLPMALPSIFLGMLLVFMEVISDYGTVSLLGIRTFTIGIYDVWFSMYDSKMAIQMSLMMLTLPVTLFLVFWIKTKTRAVYNPSNRPQMQLPKPLYSGGQYLVFLLCLLPPLFGFFIPAAVLIFWCAETLHKLDINTVYSDIFHTLFLSFIVTFSCIACGTLLSWAKRNEAKSLVLKALTWMATMNYAIPGISLAIGLLLLTGSVYQLPFGEWISNTILFLVFAAVIRYICFVFFCVEGGMKKISHQLDEAAVCAGITRWRSLFMVHLPLLKRSVIIGAALVFINITKELTMTLVLQPFNYSTLAIRVFTYAKVDMIKESAVFAVCLILIGAYPVLSLNRWLNPNQQVSR